MADVHGTVFETERLVVRPWGSDDVERFFDIYSRWEVAQWLGSVPRAIGDLDEAGAALRRWESRRTRDGRFGIWAVQVRDTGVIAGTVLLVPIPRTGQETAPMPEAGGDVEVGWHLHPDSWGHGYATEAAGAAAAKGFDDGLEEVIAVVRQGNEPSSAVCRRLGMEALGLTDRWYGVELEAFRLRAVKGSREA